MSLFPNKFLLNILAGGLILSCPLNSISAASATDLKPEQKQNGKQATETQLKWQNFTFESSGFSIDLPKKPERLQQSIDIPKSDLKINYETFLSEPSDNMVFVVSVWNYPSEIDMSKPEVNLQDGFNGMLGALQGSEVLNMKMGEVEGYKALEFLVKNEDIYFQGKLILVYNTLYQVFTVYKSSENMKENYLHFINSFKLINPEQRKVAPPAKKNGAKMNV
jgi:PsbP-like protein